MAVVIVTLGLPATAAAQAGSRQTAMATLDEHLPARSTGIRLAIDYVNPSDPKAKPPAVQKVVIKLARGAGMDTSVPARCEASDPDLMASGAGACPASSRVGGGELDLDSGIPGPAQLLQNDVTLLNAKDELILLLESKNDRRSRLVARAAIQGSTITSEVPPVPGGPPDGFAAIKRVRLKLEPRSAGRGVRRRDYVSTPRSCPASRNWTNTVTFTYRDGVSQTVASTSPCSGTARRDYKPPRIRVRGVPRRHCASHDFRARVRIAERWSGLRRAELRLDGRRLLGAKRKRFSRRIRIITLPRGHHRLVAIARDNAGNRSLKRVRFRTCRDHAA